MKTLVAYATNHGATKKYAEALAGKIPGETAIVDLKQEPGPDLGGFDAVVIGTAIYYGQPTKAVKEFCIQNLETLRAKRIGLFICSMLAEQAEPTLKTAYPSELEAVAVARGLFGGELVMKRLGFVERLIAKAVSKGGGDISKYSEEPLEGFIAALKNGQTQD